MDDAHTPVQSLMLALKGTTAGRSVISCLLELGAARDLQAQEVYISCLRGQVAAIPRHVEFDLVPIFDNHLVLYGLIGATQCAFDLGVSAELVASTAALCFNAAAEAERYP